MMPSLAVAIHCASRFDLTQVIWSTTKSPSNIRDMFSKAKVSDTNVATSIQQQVFRLEIPINDVFGVQIFDCQNHLSCIKFGNVIREALIQNPLSQMVTTSSSSPTHTQPMYSSLHFHSPPFLDVYPT